MRKYIYVVAGTALLLFVAIQPASLFGALTRTQTSSPDESRFTPPPGEETPEIKKLIDSAQSSLGERMGGPTTLLANPEYMSAHEWPRFRNLIRKYARAGQLTMVTPQEPGESLVVTGTIRNQRGEPIQGALIYVYQTSAKGWYSDKAPHISGNSGDEKYARLFGYLLTNDEGQYQLRTIRPAGYPRSNLPAHIHVEIEIREPAKTAPAGVADHAPRKLISEIQFDDDPRQTLETRARAARERSLIFPVKRAADGVQHVKADFTISEQ